MEELGASDDCEGFSGEGGDEKEEEEEEGEDEEGEMEAVEVEEEGSDGDNEESDQGMANTEEVCSTERLLSVSNYGFVWWTAE